MCSQVTFTLLRIELVSAGQEDGEARILPVTERERVPDEWINGIVANKWKVHRDRLVDGKCRDAGSVVEVTGADLLMSWSWHLPLIGMMLNPSPGGLQGAHMPSCWTRRHCLRTVSTIMQVSFAK